MIGNKLGSYELLEEIGKGGMATVYRAHQESINRDVAIKLIRKNIADTPDAVQRFQREAQLIARLEHPHILPVYDFDGRHEPPYIVMRYLEGGTLKEVMAQGQLPLHEVAYLMQQVCSAVDYANRQGIIHRDLKPSNILVDREGNAFVMDFGIARMAGNDAGKGLTETGAIIGTPDYMSPEQAMGSHAIDHRTDVYALGVMLFEMVTGQMPYSSPTSMGVLLMHIQNPIPSAWELNPDLPLGFDDVVQRAMAKKPDERYESAAELSGAISELAGGRGVPKPNRLRDAAGTSMSRRIEIEIQDSTGTSSSTVSEQNKTVTALYASAKEYALMIEENNSNEVATRATQALMKEYAKIIVDFGGGIFTQTDTEILGLWGAENARENDAEQSIRAGLAMQERLKKLGADYLGDDEEGLPLNIGINSGMALLKPTEDKSTYSASGATINIANRLMENAVGTILITHDTFRQVMGIFDMAEDVAVKMRGRKEPLQTYQVQSAKARAFHIQARGIEGIETKMVGRRAEIELLQSAYLNAFEEEETQVVTIIGDAGVGKSRMLYEFDKWAELRPELFRVFNGRATAAMRERPYALARDMISFRFDIQDNDKLNEVQSKLEQGIAELLNRQDAEMAHMIGYLCGFDLTESPHIKGLLSDAPQLVRRAKQLFIRFFTQLAGNEPVMVTLEDIHHADDASLDLFNELIVADDSLSLLIICNARPSLLERRPTWGSGQEFHRKIMLERLEKRESRDLARELLQKIADVPKELRDLLVDRSEGNPFYMEELVKMMMDERVIQVLTNDEWRVELDRLGTLNVPKTLNGLLESRLDTLLYPEKLTLQRASVVGRVFYDQALQKIDDLDEAHVGNLDMILAKLVERQFIYKRETSAFDGMVEYIFASNMLKDAIENALLERQVANYNRACAEWMLEVVGERKDEYINQIAEYYEKAGEKETAAGYLTKASEAAEQKGANAEALRLAERALALISDETTLAYAEAKYVFGTIQFRLGETPLAQSAFETSLSIAQKLQDNLLQCKNLRNLSRMYERLGDHAKAWELLEKALPLAGDDINQKLPIMSRLAWHKVMYQGEAEEGEIIAKETLEVARQHPESHLTMLALNTISIVCMSRNRLDEARQHLTEGLDLANAHHNKAQRTVFLANLGEVARMQGAFAQAKGYYLDGLSNSRESQDMDGITVALLNLSLTALSLRDVDSARTYVLEGITIAQKMEAVELLPTLCGITAGIKILENHVDEGLAILGMILSHPAADEDLRRDMETVLSLLPEGMSQAEIDAGMAKGHGLDLDTVIQEFVGASA